MKRANKIGFVSSEARSVENNRQIKKVDKKIHFLWILP